MVRVQPLKASFLFVSMVGFLISVIYITDISRDWAFAFGLLFICMFIASFVSMQYALPK